MSDQPVISKDRRTKLLNEWLDSVSFDEDVGTDLQPEEDDEDDAIA